MDRLFRSTDSSGYTTDGSSWYPRRFFQSSEDYASRKSDYAILFVFILTVALLLATFVRSFREKPINIASHPHEFAARPQLPSQLLATARASTKRIAPLRRSSTTHDAGPPQTATHPPFIETAIPDDSATTIGSFKLTDATTSYTTSTTAEFEPTSKQTSGKKSYTRVCHGSGCAQIASELEAMLDDNVDPCTDFYHHVCGKWLTNHTPPRGTAFKGVMRVRGSTLVTVKGDPFQRALVALIERFGSGNVLNYLAFRVYVRYSPFLNLLEFLELALLAGARHPGWEDGDLLEEAADLRCLRVLSKSLPEPYAYLFWNAELRNQRRVRDSTDSLVEDVIAEAVRRVREDLNLTSVVTNRFRDGMFKLRRQVFVPEWFASGNSKASYTRRIFGKGEGQPCLMLMHGALDSAASNTFLRMVNGSFETSWRGPSLRDTPWLDFDNGYLAVPPAAVDKNFTKDAFFIRHVPTLGIDLAREAFSRLTDLDLVSKIGPPGYVAHLRLEMLASCLHKQSYGNRGPGEVASREDARDLLALPVALKVFKQNAAHGSHRVGTYVTERLFFYEFALDRCESYEDSYFHQRLHHGVRSPAPYFVNGPLRNFAPFAEAFGCHPGSTMAVKNACAF
ncbi:hypothetical protein HPB52_017868 [Rhipicephalus sanguineus]|uniref:Peptidase M13 C-terminal domain-containing protein n=1 Tax=Rhipicephalus sanguineus TaxID=34632 RepID=A0A9D4Q1Q1_RHISA|nr:hypothetical protein HPB52_017868 [Rhipicephalus sanguineus]